MDIMGEIIIPYVILPMCVYMIISVIWMDYKLKKARENYYKRINTKKRGRKI